MTGFNFEEKVSIVIPVYNGSNFLKEAIDSAVSQSYNNKEIIVVNDGSDDGGKVERIARSYNDSINYYEKKRGGVSSALNYGIKRMSGNFFAWLSHDDIYERNKIEKQLGFLKLKGIEACYTKVNIINRDGKVIGKDKSNWYPRKKAIIKILKRNYINGSSVMMTNKCLEKTGLFNEDLLFTQDNEMWIRILQNYEMGLLNDFLIKYRFHKDQGTIKKGKVVKNEAQRMYKEIFDKIIIEELIINKKEKNRLKSEAKALTWFADVMSVNRSWYTFSEDYYARSLLVWNSLLNMARVRKFIGIRNILIPLRIVKKLIYLYKKLINQ